MGYLSTYPISSVFHASIWLWLPSYGPSSKVPHASEQIGCRTKRHAAAASSLLQCRLAQDWIWMDMGLELDLDQVRD